MLENCWQHFQVSAPAHVPRGILSKLNHYGAQSCFPFCQVLNPLFGYTKGSVVEAALQVSIIQQSHNLFMAFLGDWKKYLDLRLDRQRAKDADKACCLLSVHDLLYYRDI